MFLYFKRRTDLNLILVPNSVAIEVVKCEKCLGIKIFRPHVILVFPNLEEGIKRKQINE